MVPIAGPPHGPRVGVTGRTDPPGQAGAGSQCWVWAPSATSLRLGSLMTIRVNISAVADWAAA